MLGSYVGGEIRDGFKPFDDMSKGTAASEAAHDLPNTEVNA
jgi:hypothetical protein